MRSKNIAYKNFKHNIKNYISYFLSGSFCIMIFFVYTTLVFNRSLTNSIKDTQIRGIMGIAMAIIVIFSVFFISYAHTSFLRARSREFGVYMTLGMSSRDIGRLIVTENGLIAIAAIICGIVYGAIFSNLFFLALIKLMGLENIPFNLTYKSFVWTSGIYLVIFAFVISLSRFYVNRLEIADLLREKRRIRENKFPSLILGITGIILVAGSLVAFFGINRITQMQSAVRVLVAVFVLCVIGVYLTISQFGLILLNLRKLKKDAYYRDLLSLSESYYRFADNKKILFILTFLSAVTVFSSGFVYSMYVQTRDMVNEQHPYHIVYAHTLDQEKVSDEEIYSTINNQEAALKEQTDIEFIYPSVIRDGEVTGNCFVLSELQFSMIHSAELGVENGKFVLVKNMSRPEAHQWLHEGTVFHLGTREINYPFAYQKETYESVVNHNHYVAYHILVLNDEDYIKLRNAVEKENIGHLHMMTFSDWSKTDEIAQDLRKTLSHAVGERRAKSFDVVSNIENYKRARKEMSFSFFIFSFIGFLFFLSVGSVLYFKFGSEVDNFRDRYRKLYRIGVTDREIERFIGKEVVPMFFVPQFLGSLLGLASLWGMFSNHPIRGAVMRDTLSVIALFLILQLIYGGITRRKLVREVISFIYQT